MVGVADVAGGAGAEQEYLNLNKFRYVQKRAQIYHGKDENVEEEELKSDRVLDSINDSIIHQLFINIIKIIQFFCEKR